MNQTLNTSVAGLLRSVLKGRKFTPAAYPTLGGTVMNVETRSEIDAGCWPLIIFEEKDNEGVHSQYAIMDLDEKFTLD